MKKLEMNIESCTKCPFYDHHSIMICTEEVSFTRRGHCIKEKRPIEFTLTPENFKDVRLIPEWCPLPEEKE